MYLLPVIHVQYCYADRESWQKFFCSPSKGSTKLYSFSFLEDSGNMGGIKSNLNVKVL